MFAPGLVTLPTWQHITRSVLYIAKRNDVGSDCVPSFRKPVFYFLLSGCEKSGVDAKTSSGTGGDLIDQNAVWADDAVCLDLIIK